MTIYCYDTEFYEDGRTIDLISIGIVCEDGREYYAVNSDMPTEVVRKDDWLLHNVWKHLPVSGYREALMGTAGNTRMRCKTEGHLDTTSTLVKPKWVIANEVREFLLAAGEPELWAYYGAYDHVALAQLWGRMISLPKGLPMYTRDIKQEMDRVQMPRASAPVHDDEHHALADARWNMRVLEALNVA